MRKNWIIWLAVLMAVLLPFTALGEMKPNASTPDLSFSTTTLAGKSFSSSMIEKYDLVFVNFWGEWCGYCVMEMPDLEKIHKNYPNVLLLGVWYGNSVEEAIQTAKDAGVTYPLIHPAGTLETYLNKITGFPTSYFFDKNGRQLGSAYVGSRDYNSWAQIVEEMLKKVPTDPTPTEASKPVISVQPKSLTVSAGKKASFRVTASGEGLTYQWYYRTSSKAKWKKVSRNGTSDVYSFTVKAKQNGYQYRCLVKNSAGKVYSKTVKLKVK